MAKELQLSRWGANKKIKSFVKLRKGRNITDQTVKDFEKLIDSLWNNLKHHNEISVSEKYTNDYNIRGMAIRVLKSDFIKFEAGGYYKKSDIENFSFYEDGKYRAKIKGETKEISEADFYLLVYVFSSNID